MRPNHEMTMVRQYGAGVTRVMPCLNCLAERFRDDGNHALIKLDPRMFEQVLRAVIEGADVFSLRLNRFASDMDGTQRAQFILGDSARAAAARVVGEPVAV